MKKTVVKFFLAFQYDKEEKWLNEMSAKGWQLTNVGFCNYTFTEGQPGEYIYRLEMLDDWPASSKGSAYIRFLEETGAEYIGSLLRWIYVRRPASEGTFDLYSDLPSRIKHVARVRNLMLILFLCLIPIFISNFHDLFTYDSAFPIVVRILLGCVVLLLGIGALMSQLKINALRKENLLRE